MQDYKYERWKTLAISDSSYRTCNITFIDILIALV